MISLNLLGTLILGIVQMFIVQIIELELDKLSGLSSQSDFLILIGYNTAMVIQGPVLAHLRQYWPEGFSPRANASEGVPIRTRGIP